MGIAFNHHHVHVHVHVHMIVACGMFRENSGKFKPSKACEGKGSGLSL